jgi:hypothetical protein
MVWVVALIVAVTLIQSYIELLELRERVKQPPPLVGPFNGTDTAPTANATEAAPASDGDVLRIDASVLLDLLLDSNVNDLGRLDANVRACGAFLKSAILPEPTGGEREQILGGTGGFRDRVEVFVTVMPDADADARAKRALGSLDMLGRCIDAFLVLSPDYYVPDGSETYPWHRAQAVDAAPTNVTVMVAQRFRRGSLLALREFLGTVQNPAVCSAADLAFTMVDGGEWMGVIDWVLPALSKCTLFHGTTLVIGASQGWYGDTSICGSMNDGWPCLMLPLSACTPFDFPASTGVPGLFDLPANQQGQGGATFLAASSLAPENTSLHFKPFDSGLCKIWPAREIPRALLYDPHFERPIDELARASPPLGRNNTIPVNRAVVNSLGSPKDFWLTTQLMVWGTRLNYAMRSETAKETAIFDGLLGATLPADSAAAIAFRKAQAIPDSNSTIQALFPRTVSIAATPRTTWRYDYDYVRWGGSSSIANNGGVDEHDSACVAVHIRHTDVITANTFRPEFNLTFDEYMDAARRTLRAVDLQAPVKRPANAVLVLTDDPAWVLDRLKRPQFADLRISVLGGALPDGTHANHLIMSTIYSSLHLAARCSGFVGNIGSGFTRFIVQNVCFLRGKCPIILGDCVGDPKFCNGPNFQVTEEEARRAHEL